MKNKGTFILGIFVILAIAGCIAYATGFDPFTPKGSVESREAIREFIGDPYAIVVFEKSDRNVLGESYDTYRVNGNKFTVDTGSGSVIGASFFSVPMTNEKKIYLQQAESSAKEFAVRHYNNFYSRTMQLTESEERHHRFAGIEYSFTWSEQSGNGNTTNVVRVSTNTEGRVVSYYARDKNPSTAEPATIGKDQAIETATRYVIDRSKIDNITYKNATIRPGFTPYHEKVVWIVDVEIRFMNTHAMEDHSGGAVELDAMTGELLDYNPCL